MDRVTRKGQKTSNLLYKKLDDITRKAQKEILDNVQCAIEGTDRWNAVRSRILGSTNSAKRELWEEIQRNWTIQHSPNLIREDVIYVNSVQGKEKSSDGKGSKKD